MSDPISDEEICQQLLELAQTPEQIRYLSMNNSSILKEKIEQLKEEVNNEKNKRKINDHINAGAETAYLKVIEQLGKLKNGCHYD